ncbi:hypothetical protein CRE_05928 [Caenorhabditis remanei]|uniref:Uncharacterized protein n=1 Tax=Caenorhabditis remanei TaxID=31234 RepID=E3MZB8_CAERE|nr:hypothetical protein CRE_05928 [Caenorhabditis remanei]
MQLGLNGAKDLNLNVESWSTTINIHQDNKYDEQSGENQCATSSIFENPLIIGVIAIFIHYLLLWLRNKMTGDGKTNKQTGDTVVHASFEIDGDTYILLKCNNSNDSYSEDFEEQDNEIGETYF